MKPEDEATLDDALDHFYYWIINRITEDRHPLLMDFEGRKLEFRRHMKEIIKYASR